MARMFCSNDDRTCWDHPDASGSPDVEVNQSGYPTEAARAVMWAPYASGTYSVTWDGAGTFTFSDLGSGAFTKGPDQDGHHTGTLRYVANSQISLNVQTPPISNLHIMSPSTDYEPGHVFRRDFLRRLAPFSTLRMMDPLKTNSNTVIRWSERNWPDQFSAAKANGMPYEDIIRLANESGKDVWINVPVLADDNYVCRMARLFRFGEPGDRSDAPCDPAAPAAPPAGAVPLSSGIKLYVEFSNEIWNWAFPAVGSVFCMVWGVPDDRYNDPPQFNATCPWGITAPTSAIGQAALANASLPWSTNAWERTSQYVAVLTRRISTVFRTVFASAPDQVKVVLDAQCANPEGDATSQLAFLRDAYGDARQTFDMMAVAPYLDLVAADGNQVTLSGSSQTEQLNSLFANLNTSLQSTIASWLSRDKTVAARFGIPLISYEGGQGLNGSAFQQLKQTAQDDSRMYDTTIALMETWKRIVGTNALFNYYSFSNKRGEYGSWGALENAVRDPGSQKWDALMTLIRPPGDANLDGLVDDTDLAIIQANIGRTGMWWEQGDFNHDRTVNAADTNLFNQYQAQY